MEKPVSYYEKNFDHADLRGFDFRGTDLRRASFNYAHLEGALFYGARMDGGTSFYNATLPYFDYFPERGSFEAFKVLFNPDCADKYLIAKVNIPENSLRTSSLVYRGGWVSEIITLEGEGESMPYNISHEREIYRYAAEKRTRHKAFTSDYRLKSCCDRHGIQVFLTRREAEGYVKPLVEQGFYRWKTEYTWGCNREDDML